MFNLYDWLLYICRSIKITYNSTKHGIMIWHVLWWWWTIEQNIRGIHAIFLYDVYLHTYKFVIIKWFRIFKAFNLLSYSYILWVLIILYYFVIYLNEQRLYMYWHLFVVFYKYTFFTRYKNVYIRLVYYNHIINQQLYSKNLMKIRLLLIMYLILISNSYTPPYIHIKYKKYFYLFL